MIYINFEEALPFDSNTSNDRAWEAGNLLPCILQDEADRSAKIVLLLVCILNVLLKLAT